MPLRDYQQEAVDAAVNWLSKARGSGGIIRAPTGSGKSHIIAEICRHWLQANRKGIIIILVPTREIIVQDARILLDTNIPVGICCAGLGRKDVADGLFQVIIASPGSFRAIPDDAPYTDALLIIDEAHRVNLMQENTIFRRGIRIVRNRWPKANLIGLTATPQRLGTGDITRSKLWPDILYEIKVQTLIDAGYLVPLVQYARPVFTPDQLRKAKNGGEYSLEVLGEILSEEADDDIESVMRDIQNQMVAGRRKGLIFCPTVKTATEVAEMCNQWGMSAAALTGRNSSAERDCIIDRYKNGDLSLIVNCSVLTTGFDAPETDLIVLLIATASWSKYYQIIGRGMRPAFGKKNCMVIDGGGNAMRHGLNPDAAGIPTQPYTCSGCNRMFTVPVTDELESRTQSGNFVTCPECGRGVYACPTCNHVWDNQLTTVVHCPNCGIQVYPPPLRFRAGDNVTEFLRKLYTEIPITTGYSVKTQSGKTFYAASPNIRFVPYVSNRGTPCLKVLNACRKVVYMTVELSQTKQYSPFVRDHQKKRKAAIGYVITGRTTDVLHDNPPTTQTILTTCEHPRRKVIAVSAVERDGYTNITHMLVNSGDENYECVDIERNLITPEVVLGINAVS